VPAVGVQVKEDLAAGSYGLRPGSYYTLGDKKVAV